MVSIRPKHYCNKDQALIGCGFRNVMGFACSLLMLLLLWLWLSDRNILQICVSEHNNRMAIVVNAHVICLSKTKTKQQQQQQKTGCYNQAVDWSLSAAGPPLQVSVGGGGGDWERWN